mmetsp:Transcript_36719/g.122955  ORF Transcript_36719/g.122955 Transcript_36719/m.122955 type:complete len:285 (+) Transcript_36719:27-881(+)
MLAATLSRPASKATRCRCARAASSLIASIDQGTSSSRVILYDAVTLRPVASHQVELQSATSNPQAGWSQMDAKRIVGTVTDSAAAALAAAGASASDVVGVGITNQRESTVVWDKRTGEPLYDCILWHDARTATTVSALADELGGQDALRPACGLPLSTYFSGVKLRWLLETVPAVKEGFESGTALVGTVDSWLAWNLTGGAGGRATRHVSDVTNASRTMLMDLSTCGWDRDLVRALGVGAAEGALPTIVSCAEEIGRVDGGPLHGDAAHGEGWRPAGLSSHLQL